MDPFELLVTEDLTDKSIEEVESAFLKKEEGRILFLGRIPVASLHATFLAGIYMNLMNVVGKAAKGLIVNSAKNEGMRAGKSIRRKYVERFGELTEDVALKVVRNVITVWDKCFGWGIFEFEVIDEVISIKVWDSFEALGCRRIRKDCNIPMCWMLLGYIWGMLEGLLESKLVGEEKMCLAKGDEHCLFEFRRDQS